MKKIVLKKNQWWIMTIICLLIMYLVGMLFLKLGIFDYLEQFSLFSCPGNFLCKVPVIETLSNPFAFLCFMGFYIAVLFIIFEKIFDISNLE